MPEHGPSVCIKTDSDVAWIKVNNDFKGYFYVNYDKKTWRTFISILKDPVKRRKVKKS